MQEIMKYLGKRVLCKEIAGFGCVYDSVFEATILEISSSGDYLQIMFTDKSKSWKETRFLMIIEELPELAFEVAGNIYEGKIPR